MLAILPIRNTIACGNLFVCMLTSCGGSHSGSRAHFRGAAPRRDAAPRTGDDTTGPGAHAFANDPGRTGRCGQREPDLPVDRFSCRRRLSAPVPFQGEPPCDPQRDKRRSRTARPRPRQRGCLLPFARQPRRRGLRRTGIDRRSVDQRKRGRRRSTFTTSRLVPVARRQRSTAFRADTRPAGHRDRPFPRQNREISGHRDHGAVGAPRRARPANPPQTRS